MAESRLPSLDLVLDEARSERQAHLSHFEALDAKAGVVLGFAGLLVVLAPDRADPLVLASRLPGALSALAALVSFWPRQHWRTDLVSLRERYLTSEVAFTKLNLIDAMIAETFQVRLALRHRTHVLRIATAALALAVLSVAATSA